MRGRSRGRGALVARLPVASARPPSARARLRSDSVLPPMSALNTPGQDDLQQAHQDPQQQIPLNQDIQQPQQNGDTPPVSEGSRKRMYPAYRLP